MPLAFTSLKVTPHYEIDAPGGFDLHWTISGETFVPTFQVLMADTESGPTWTAMLTSRTPNLYALNLGEQRRNGQSALSWFKVEIYNGSALKLTSPPMDSRATMERHRYLQYREVLRRTRVFFNKTVCLDGWLVRRKIYGVRCPLCADQILSTASSSECPTCFGTGITGGYFPPYALKSDWSVGVSPRTTNKTEKTAPGPQQIQRLRIKIPHLPDAKNEDLWFDKGTGIYYLIEEVAPDMWTGSTIAQLLTLSKLPSHHQVYRLTRPT